ncbi:3-hydroxyisobutyryl-CoA hydrolase [Streptomyces albidoflavus]|uniref:enoyl-CoA hydratase/isomerase family protein n=1 Tax=Streptomyces TaxID=1883 RepID=UPI0001AEE93C|nr:enoyl-CoA hydratase/isomerase family protein [Streptomyces albidoflavus]BDH49151.1 putative enoyl-CoA hydratase [Streptomyces albus]AGI86557.1 3-hydroxyisobutyryl-CoA hydrolase [Streptomyces albidoflavus]EFE85323.1 3-hydroxyisobutyrate dehydrogenase [Streptomyces albidoflavus]QLP90328.1 3-hydroxyisobutyryl-CoA hydrolase [Streptomyces albidoflavus]WAE08842.1 3-hydroxyisobutyryl-CoA hydrolase [Streptomyces albidoflavus]
MSGVRFRREGRAGHLVLDRPEALNALTHAMVRAVDAKLAAWEHDPGIATVVLTGAGERGLCAGGDIRAIHDAARSGDATAATAFWRDEYRLDARIARYPKPYVAVMDGIVMGGGVGLSAQGSVRIVTERSRIAMPETGIGFVPDVGGTYLLALAPGELGTYLALTGTPVGAADALLCGLADHYVPSASLGALVADLAELPVGEALARHVQPPPPGELAERRDAVDACFSAGTVEEIVRRLKARGTPADTETATTLLANSPTALKVTLAALRRARRLGPLERVLDQEYRVSCATLTSPDLVEGIRARVIDKDRAPRWSPSTLGEVGDADVERFFTPLGERELGLAAPSDTSEEVVW